MSMLTTTPCVSQTTATGAGASDEIANDRSPASFGPNHLAVSRERYVQLEKYSLVRSCKLRKAAIAIGSRGRARERDHLGSPYSCDTRARNYATCVTCAASAEPASPRLAPEEPHRIFAVSGETRPRLFQQDNINNIIWKNKYIDVFG